MGPLPVRSRVYGGVRMTRKRTAALAIAIVAVSVLLVSMAGVPIAIGDSSPPSGMSGISADAIDSDIPACDDGGPPDHAGGGNPICGVHEDLQDQGVYVSDHAGTMNVTVTNPGQAKQYTDGSVFGDGPIALVFSDDEHSDARDVALPTEVIEDIFGYQPPVAYGTYEDGDQWAAPIVYDDGYAVFEIPHFSDQVVTMEGEISISSDSAMSGDTWSYEIDDGESVDNLSLSIVGVNHTELNSTSATLGHGDTIELNIGGNEPGHGAKATLKGITNEEQRTISGTTDDTISIGGNLDAEVDSIEVTGESFTSSESSTSSSPTISGTDDATNVELTVTASSSWQTEATDYEGSGIGATSDDGEVVLNYETYDAYQGEICDATVDLIYHSSDGSGSFTHTIRFYDRWDESTTFDERDVTFTWDGDNYVADPYTISNCEKVEAGGNDNRISIAVERTDGSITSSHQGDFTAHELSAEYAPEDVSATFDGNTENIGDMSPGQTETFSYSDRSPGDYSVDQTYSGSGSVTTTLSWTETHETIDPVLRVDGSTVAEYSGKVTDGETVSLNILTSELASGDRSLEYDPTGDTTAGEWELDLTERTASENPSIDIDGGSSFQYDGILESGQDHTFNINDSNISNTVSGTVSIDDGKVVGELSINETTHTEDTTITINGEHTVSNAGKLEPGERDVLTADVETSWLVEGENTIEVDVAPDIDGPEGKVKFDWNHSGDASKVVNHSGEVFSEVSTFEHTWVEDQDDATITVEWASDRVIRLGNLEVTHNGTVIDDPSYAFSESDIIINLGSVEAGETTEVELTGWKIAAENGDIEVTSPTDEGIDLVTTFEVTETTAEALTLQVGGHDQGHLVHVLDESTDAPDEWDVRTLADGSQEVRMPDVAVGDSIRIETTDLEIWPNAGDVVIDPIDADADEPEFALSYEHSAGDSVDVTWHGAESGETYELYSQSDNRVVDTATASSPVTFATNDDPTTYLIQLYDPPGSDSPPAAGPIDDSDMLPGPLWLWVLGAVLASIFVLAFITDRFGDDEGDRDVGVSVPVVGNVGFTMPGLARSPILVGGMLIVGIIALEALTPRTLFSPDAIPIEQIWILTAGVGLILSIWAVHTRTRIDLPDWLLYTVVALVGLGMLEFLFSDGLVSLLSVELGIALETGEVAQVLIGIGILLALWQIDTRTTDSIPIPILIAAGAITIVWVLETIQPGVILGGLSEGFATVSPLFWLIVVVGGAYFARAYIRAQRAPDTQVQLQLGEGEN